VNNLPLVTVVTPCLNPGDRLRRCVASVAAQTHPAVEHVVVDGGSSDATLDFLSGTDVRWISEQDEGQAQALNKGFRLARGNLIGWLNADDVLTHDAVAAAVASLESSPEAGWVYGDCEIVEVGRPPSTWRPQPVTGPESFFSGNVVPQPGTFITRHALERVGGVSESFHLAMDFDLWLRLADAGFLGIYVPRTLATFEIHSASKSGSQPLSSFLREEALALCNSGRRRQAEAKLGEAAAVAAASGDLIRRRDLVTETDDAISWAASRGMLVRARQVRGWAALAASRTERRHNVDARHVRHVLRPEPWLASTTRRIMIVGLARRSRGIAERVTRLRHL
jgi:glycosyltransferase involved in cell wall biosynthesis